MAHRQKNLLEAFNASAAIEKSESERTSDSSAAGGPFALETQPAVQSAPDVKPGLAESLLHPENRGGLLVLAGLGLTLAFLAGRASVRRVEAEEDPALPGTRAPEQVRAALPTPGAAPATQATAEPELSQEPRTQAERALLDPENRYTIKLVEYSNSERDEELAWEAFYYLEDQGLPAAVLGRGQRLFIVVGAARQQAQLDDLLQRAKTMKGPPPRSKKAEFFDAYVDKIDKFIQR